MSGKYYIDKKNYLNIEGIGNNILVSGSSIEFLITYDNIKQHFSDPGKMKDGDMAAFYKGSMPYNLHCTKINDATRKVVIAPKTSLSNFEECVYKKWVVKK